VVSSVRRTETYFAGAKVSGGSRLIVVVIAESLVVVVIFVRVITNFIV